MIAQATHISPSPRPSCHRHATPTLWGLGVEELHDRLWASLGVRVVRRGAGGEVGSLPRGGAYLLVKEHALVAADAARVKKFAARGGRLLAFLRLRGERAARFVERVVTGPAGEFHRFERDYRGTRRHYGKCAMTTDPEVARRWRDAERAPGSWRRLRAAVPAERRAARAMPGRVYDGASERGVADFARAAVGLWPRPDRATKGLARRARGVWVSAGEDFGSPALTVLGRAWIGRGRRVGAVATVVGPAVLWDAVPELPGHEADAPNRSRHADVAARGGDARQGGHEHAAAGHIRLPGKRAFDVVFASVALLLTLPLYPLVMLAIWLEDGRPFFYGHRREGRGGREFPCWKFRSMRRDADRMRAALEAANQADGPQFFMTDDPRLTRVGALLRRLNLDELPQFWNVLRGDMSVVGPRPSPHDENQFCPEWREARLSVRPGITGLWQVKRTRRAGSDFQEWIKYDIEYVDRAGWGLDLWIILRTIACLLRKGGR